MFPIKNIMTKDVVSVTSDTPIYEAIEQLVVNRISGVPVVTHDMRLVGVLSEWDVLQLLTEKEVGKERTVESYMTKEVISFDENESALKVCEFFKDSYKRRAPVIRDGKLVGVVSRHDVIELILRIRRKISR